MIDCAYELQDKELFFSMIDCAYELQDEDFFFYA